MDDSANVTDEQIWEAAGWYRALSLDERTPPCIAPATEPSPDERARGRLQDWRLQKPFDRESLFTQRLAADGLTEDDLLALLAEPADALKARVGKVPDWLAALRDAFAGPAASEGLDPLLGDVERDHPLAACLPALAPLLQRGLSAVEERLQARREAGTGARIDADALRRSFVANVAPILLFQVGKPLVLELHIARLREQLHGETPDARFRDFVRHLRHEGGFLSLLLKYPVLARQLTVTVDQWAEFLSEIVEHLHADWDAICTTFSPEGDPGRVIAVEAQKGDRHRRGRSVTLLRFASGLRLMYKPKPLRLDVHFQQLLSWLNERGAEPPLRPLTLLDRGEYGWSEFVAASPCRSEDEVTRFYERLGGHLALLYALDAADLHNENLIADGEHPALVDLEALFHPHVYEEDPLLTANPAAGVLDRSVWQVGLLPRRVWADEESIGVDISGLGGEAGQMNPHRLVGWEERGTDELRLGRTRVELPASENRPRAGDEDIDPLDYRSALLAGFTRTYRLLMRHRDALLAEQLPRFAHDEIRVVVRSTNVYGLLWYESFHPDLLRDGLDRDWYFDRLWAEVTRRPDFRRVVAAERRDLLRGDIPSFSASPADRTLVTSEGEPLPDFLRAPSLDVVRDRVAQLGEDDLATQTWIVEASLSTLLMDREDRIARPAWRASADGTIGGQRLLALAQAAGRRLHDLALQTDAGASWLGVGPLDATTWGVLPSGTDLYAGTGGIALFLAHLGGVTGEPVHTQLARRAVMSLRSQSRTFLDSVHDEEETGMPPAAVGAFEGLASVVYALTHLGVLWDEPGLLDEAEELVAALPPLVARDDRLDVIYGSAGCLLALLSLHAVRPTPRILQVATACGERLGATCRATSPGTAWTTLDGEPPLAGFSHGVAGIAYSLLKLAARTSDERFRVTALDALAYERSLFDAELDNWADLRTFGGTRPAKAPENVDATDRTSMVAWCHGAPGIGLARLGALEVLDDPQVRDEIDIALHTTTAYGFAMNHSLCHGALGNVDLLLTAAQVLDRPQDHEALEEAISVIAASIEANGWVTGVPLGVETPGLMTGLAGMGYQLLRLAEPGQVPSVLLLEPPSGSGPA